MAAARKRRGGGSDTKKGEKQSDIKTLFREVEERRTSGVEREQRRLSAVECETSSELHPYWVEHLRISLGAGNSRARVAAYLDAMQTLLIRGDGLPPDEEFDRLVDVVRNGDADLATRAFGIFRMAVRVHPSAEVVELRAVPTEANAATTSMATMPTATTTAAKAIAAQAGSSARGGAVTTMGLRVNKRAWEPIGGSRRRDEQQDYDDAGARTQRTSAKDEWQRFVYTLKGALVSMDVEDDGTGAKVVKGATRLGHRLFFKLATTCILDDLTARSAVYDDHRSELHGGYSDVPMLLDATLYRLLEVANSFAAGMFSRGTGFFELLIAIITKASIAAVDSDFDATVSADDMKVAAARLLRGAMLLYRRLEEAGMYHEWGKRVSRNTGRNMRVEIDKDISDRVRNLKKDCDKLAVLRELVCPETKLRIVCRIISERTVRCISHCFSHMFVPHMPLPNSCRVEDCTET